MMTANPTVPADVWACKQPGVPLVAAVVEVDCECRSCMYGNREHPPAWLVDVVPVVDPDTAGREPQRPAVVVYGDSGRRVYYERQRTPQYGDVRLTPAHVDALAAACGKPPADWVDGYAVILTTTDQEAE